MSEAITESEFIERMMKKTRELFYKHRPEAEFFQDSNILKQMLTELAAWLEHRKVSLTFARQATILMGIFRLIKEKGDTGNIRRMSVYLLDCVQKHLKHHGDEYYDEGIRTRNAIDDVMRGLKRGAGRPVADSGNAVERLAELNRMMRAGRGGRKKAACKPAAQVMQLDFLKPSKQ